MQMCQKLHMSESWVKRVKSLKSGPLEAVK